MSAFFAVLTGLGVGSGGLYILYLTEIMKIPQKEAQGLNLFFFFTCILSASIFNLFKNRIVKKTLFPLLFFGILSSLFTSFLVQKFEGEVLKKLFGIFLIFLGALGLFSGKK